MLREFNLTRNSSINLNISLGCGSRGSTWRKSMQPRVNFYFRHVLPCGFMSPQHKALKNWDVCSSTVHQSCLSSFFFVLQAQKNQTGRTVIYVSTRSEAFIFSFKWWTHVWWPACSVDQIGSVSITPNRSHTHTHTHWLENKKKKKNVQILVCKAAFFCVRDKKVAEYG